MQKTPDEIKKGLELCYEDIDCSECPYLDECFGNDEDPFGAVMPDALAYIQQLERERDAAVADIHKTCSTCKHYYYNRQDDDTADCLWFDGCKSEDHWQWRGVKEE